MNKPKQFCINLVSALKAKLKKHKDKVYHFLGCAIGVFAISRFIHMDYAIFGTLLFGIGIEVGDLKNYGVKELKSKDKTRIQMYLKNTIGDLIADVWGILVVSLILSIWE